MGIFSEYFNTEMIGAKIARGVSGTAATRVFSLVIGFVTTFLLARLLDADGYGTYAYALAWVNLLHVPAMIGFDKLLVRETAIAVQQENWPGLRGITKWTNVLTTVVALLITVCIIIASHYLSTDDNRNKALAIQLASPLVPLLALTGLRRATLRGLGHVVAGQVPESIARPLLLVIILLSIAFVLPDHVDFQSAILANLAAALIAFIFGSILLLRRLPQSLRSVAPQYHGHQWIRSAFPLVTLGVLQVANVQIAMLILGAYHSSQVVGQFAVAFQVSSLGSFFLLSFNAVLAPEIAKAYSAGDMSQLQTLVTNSSRLMCLLTLPIVLGFLFFGKFVLGLFGTDFIASYPALMIMAVGVFFSSTMGSVGLLLTMTGYERDAARIIAGLLVLNVVLGLVLIPRYGAIGAASATAVYAIVSNILLGVFVYRRTKIIPSIFGLSR